MANVICFNCKTSCKKIQFGLGDDEIIGEQCPKCKNIYSDQGTIFRDAVEYYGDSLNAKFIE